MAKVKLTLASIRRIASQLPELARKCQLDIAKEYKEFVEQELQRQHHTGRSIYGDTYPRPKKGNQPMFDTGELSQSYDVQVMPGGKSLIVRNESEHTIVNHDGKHTHLPDGRGTPERWKKRLEVIKRKHARQMMQRVRELAG